MTDARVAAFPGLAAELRPRCERLADQYEQRQSALLPIVHLFQEREGFVSPEAMRFAAEFLSLTPAVVESTVSFYTLFFRKPVGKYVLQVCRGLSCSLADADEMMAYFRERLGIGNLETTADGTISYEEVECLAACDRATCMQVNLEYVFDLTREKIDRMVEEIQAGTYPVAPMAQTQTPGPTWRVSQDGDVSEGGKSFGATAVPDANNAGGLGDRTGTIMLDRIVDNEIVFGERSRERSVRDARGIEAVRESNGHAGH